MLGSDCSVTRLSVEIASSRVAVCPFMALSVISLPRGNSVAFGLKRTWAGFYEYRSRWGFWGLSVDSPYNIETVTDILARKG